MTRPIRSTRTGTRSTPTSGIAGQANEPPTLDGHPDTSMERVAVDGCRARAQRPTMKRGPSGILKRTLHEFLA